MKPGPSLWVGVGALLFASAWGARAVGLQTTGSKNPPLVMESVNGKDLFEFYCASCHGRDGRGGGPTAPALKTPPPDLTSIARRAGGAFPRTVVERLVAGDGALMTPAHGSRDMPVWGPIFKGLDPRDTLVSIRISNVVAYVESMQPR